ncbi:Gamma-tubulin complex component 5 [Nowakowskiella sp. JEL0078]|nr:Gamma-tubulin complex component 5 [Nowakowskiella sp. JEL0078]
MEKILSEHVHSLVNNLLNSTNNKRNQINSASQSVINSHSNKILHSFRFGKLGGSTSGGGRNNHVDILRRYSSVCEKLILHDQEEKATSLKKLINWLIRNAEKNTTTGESPYTLYLVADVLYLLLLLSISPTRHEYTSPVLDEDEDLSWFLSSERLHRVHPLIWKEIVEEEPLTGDHWDHFIDNDPQTDLFNDNYSNFDIDQQRQKRWRDEIIENAPTESRFNKAKPMEVSNEQNGDNTVVGFTKLEDVDKIITEFSKNQYWNVHSTYWKSDPMTSLSMTRQGINDSCLLNPSLIAYRANDTRYIQSLSSIPVFVTELIIIREVLFLLGATTSRNYLEKTSLKDWETGHIFNFDEESQKFKISKGLAIAHLSDTALRNMLNSFVQVGSAILRIRNFQIQSQQFGKKCQSATLQAFSSAISEIVILPFDQILVKCESFYQNYQRTLKDKKQGSGPSTTTLLDFFNRMEGWFHLLTEIDSYLVQYILLKLKENENDSTENPNEVASLTKKMTKNEWSDQYKLRGTLENSFVPKLFRKFVQKILGTGKAINLIRKIVGPNAVVKSSKKIEDSINSTSIADKKVEKVTSNSKIELEKMFPNAVHSHLLVTIIGVSNDNELENISKNKEELKFNIWKPMDECIQEALVASLDPLYEFVGKELSDVLFGNQQISKQITGGGLMEELICLQGVCFMLDGDVMHSFTSEIFKSFETGEILHDPNSINSHFQENFANINDLRAKSTKVNWSDSKNITKSRHILFSRPREARKSGEKRNRQLLTLEILNQIVIHVQIPWPLDIIIMPEETLPKYNQVFRLLLKLKFSQNVLIQHCTSWKWRAAHERIVKKRTSLRFHLFHFVEALNHHLMTSVIHAESSKFLNSIIKMIDVDEMVSLHSKFVSSVRDRCLLNTQTESILSDVISIMEMCLVFAEFCKSYDDAVTSAESIGLKASQMRVSSKKLVILDLDNEDDLFLPGRTEEEDAINRVIRSETTLENTMDKIMSDLQVKRRFVIDSLSSLASHGLIYCK